MSESLYSTYPAFKALEKLSSIWKSPDSLNFAVYEEISPYLIAHVSLNIPTNSYIGENASKKYTLHIHQIVVNDELRGCGIFGYICKTLIDVAEESGIFLSGVARAFNASLPEIRNGDEYLDYLATDQFSYKKKKNEFRESKSLLRKYLDNGFCRFDGSGFRVNDRRWKTYSFGYASSKLDGKLGGFFQKHLFC